MGHDGRGLGERLHSTEGFCASEDLQAREESSGLSKTSFDVEGQHAREAAALLLGDLMLRVRGQARVVHFLNRRMGFQELSEGLSILPVSLHTKVEGLQATQGEVAVHRARNTTKRVLQEAQLGVDFVRVGDDNSSNNVRVTVDVPTGQRKRMVNETVNKNV